MSDEFITTDDSTPDHPECPFLLDSDHVSGTPKYAKIQVGRNDPCPCGSGMKYKNCCINKKQVGYQSKVLVAFAVVFALAVIAFVCIKQFGS